MSGEAVRVLGPVVDFRRPDEVVAAVRALDEALDAREVVAKMNYGVAAPLPRLSQARSLRPSQTSPPTLASLESTTSWPSSEPFSG